MTNSSHGPEDSDGGQAPYLPPPRTILPAASTPTDGAAATAEPAELPPPPSLPATGGGAPFVPVARPVAPPHVERPEFDAKSMLDSQKAVNANPAYGSLPTAREDSRAAAAELRKDARRKRRRDKWFGRVVAAVVLGAVGAAGWSAYQAYQDEQDRRAIEFAEAQDAPSDEVDAAAAPQDLDAAAPDDAGAAAPPGRVLDATDDARRDVAGQADRDPQPGSVTASDPFEARAFDFVYRRWDSASASSPMVEHLVSYDSVDDTYIDTSVTTGGDGTVVITSADDSYLTSISSDGVIERFPRSGKSLDPEADFALGRPMRPADVLPDSVAPFAELVERRPGTDGGDLASYVVDTAAWRDADPGSFLTWVTTWRSRLAGDDSLVELDRREVEGEPRDLSALDEITISDIETRLPDPTTANAFLTFVTAPEGHLFRVEIADPTAGFRSQYQFGGTHDDRVALLSGGDSWEPSP